MIESHITLNQVSNWIAEHDNIWADITDSLWNTEPDEMQLSRASIMQVWNAKYCACGITDGYNQMIVIRDKRR